MASRRDLLRSLAALSALSALPTLSRSSHASTTSDQRLVVVVLRGGLDGLALLPPHGDPAYSDARQRMALPLPGEQGGILDLDGFFGLHPAMADLLPLYAAGEMLGVHAVGLPDTQRSHFDAQDMLESGAGAPHALKTGWLNRALSVAAPHSTSPAIVIGQSVPLVLRGPAPVTSILAAGSAPSADPFLEMVSGLYTEDRVLSQALEQGLMTQSMLEEQLPGRRGRGAKKQARSTGQLLAHPEGPRVAVMTVGGVDTHASQRATLSTRLRKLTENILALREGLGSAWSETAVVLITEFGRTVSSNGTGGTDHGTASAALLLGGAIAGRRVISDWPGLTRLHEGRDLRVTTDLRSVLAGVLRDHLGLAGSGIFPDAPAALPGLIRAV